MLCKKAAELRMHAYALHFYSTGTSVRKCAAGQEDDEDDA
jgi:hypothetical protein